MNILTPLTFLAQATQPIAKPWYSFFFESPLPLIVAAFAVMMLLSGRTKKNQEKQKQDMLKNMKRGDEVETIGGVIGKVFEVRDDRVQVKVDETSNTKMWFRRTAIHRVVTEDKAAG